MLCLTYGLVHYAKATIEEGKKDRKKDAIEKKLEKIYSPIFDILHKAKFDTTRYAWKIGSDESLVLVREYREIHKRLATYGHYLPTENLQKFENALKKHRYTRLKDASEFYYLFSEADIGLHYEYFRTERDRLAKELEDLTKTD